jgi:uncharacterized protein YceH (UPF0502 family)
VVGSLIEKELTTPDQYPLTIKSLVAACNQASNRDPVVTYDESTVTATLNELKGQRLVRFVLPSHGRSAIRYRQVLGEAMGVDTRQGALLAVLLLRGPQTVGELRARTDRMTIFDSLGEVEHELRFLSTMAEPLAADLGRRPGQKEERWICLLSSTEHEEPAWDRMDPTPNAEEHTSGFGGDRDDDQDGRFGELQSEIAGLRDQLVELRADLDALRSSLGG